MLCKKREICFSELYQLRRRKRYHLSGDGSGSLGSCWKDAVYLCREFFIIEGCQQGLWNGWSLEDLGHSEYCFFLLSRNFVSDFVFGILYCIVPASWFFNINLIRIEYSFIYEVGSMYTVDISALIQVPPQWHYQSSIRPIYSSTPAQPPTADPTPRPSQEDSAATPSYETFGYF